MTKKISKIVILGAGFCGLRVARDLSRLLRKDEAEIVLVDKSDKHIYTPDLYEVASNFHPEITEECLVALENTVATDIISVINLKRVEFVCSEVEKIDVKKRKIHLSNNRNLEFDYLVVALGSVVNYYGIPGLAQFSYPVKTVDDAMALNCHLDVYFQNLWRKGIKKEILINVGGGGITGVEFASELYGYLKLLARKYKFPPSKIKVQIIQGSDALIGVGEKVGMIVKKRLESRGVKVILGQHIHEVGPDWILLKSNPGGKIKRIKSDILIWTGGVKVNSLVAESLGDAKFGGGIRVDAYLESLHHKKVYAGGDNIFFKDNISGNISPMLAQSAIEHGRIIAKNITSRIKGGNVLKYNVKNYPIVVPLAGKFAVLISGSMLLYGLPIWILRRIIDLKYAISILPFWKALRKWQHGNRIFIKND